MSAEIIKLVGTSEPVSAIEKTKMALSCLSGANLELVNALIHAKDGQPDFDGTNIVSNLCEALLCVFEVRGGIEGQHAVLFTELSNWMDFYCDDNGEEMAG